MARILRFQSLVAVVIAAHAFLVVDVVRAQDGEAAAVSEPSAEGVGGASARAGAPRLRWESGPAEELWAAPALSLSLGGLSLALAVVLGQVATANHREATDPATTQLRASELAPSIPDLSLAANVLFAVGGGLALIGVTWMIVLPFSQHPVASVRASLGPTGLSLTGSF